MPLLRSLARLWTVILAGTALTLTLAVAARLLIPLSPWLPTPTLLSSEPRDGATEVLPRTPIELRFNVPVNRVSVARALRIDPPTPGELRWSDDATRLTFHPLGALTPNVTYTVSIGPGALGRWWQPFEPSASVRFSTAPQPAVVSALPQATGVAADSALAVIFSQPMVAPERVGLPTELPQLSLDPPVSTRALWLDQRTLLLRPTAPLAPATRYEARIDASLTDLRGVELGAPFSWSFTTGWPNIVERSPTDGARWVSPRTPLTLRLSPPLDEGLLAQTLQIEPAISGELATAQIGATQVITFTPQDGWAYGTSYTVRLVEPPGSELGAPPVEPWSFEIEPAPRLVAVFPGQGQLLAPGQPIRLVFSTPMDEAALRAGISVEPPVDELPLQVSETEVRLTPALRPSTLYTITVAADTPDRSGEPLSAPAIVRLRTTPAPPALRAPEAFAGLVTLPVSQTATVELETTNLSALELSLYQLDQATLLRALELRPEERRDFQPERYGQLLARRWRVERNEPLDQPAPLTLPVGLTDGEPLAPGAYLLRAESPEGPRSDLLLLVSGVRLTLRQGPTSALIWATDSATGDPVPNLPVALYRGAALVARGSTGPDGTWTQPIAPGAEPLLAIAEAGGPALVRGDWLAEAPPAPPAYSSLLFADQLAYRPGETVRLSGLARLHTSDGRLAMPAPDAICRLQLRSASGAIIVPGASCAIDPATGRVSGELTLTQRLTPGEYQLAALIGDGGTTLPLRIEGPPAAPSTLDLAAALTPSQELRASISRAGLPLAGAPVSWTLRLEPLAPPQAPEGYTLGRVELAEPITLEGQSVTDEQGSFLTDSLAELRGATGLRYRLQATVVEGNGDVAVAVAEGRVPPATRLAALRLPSRLVPSDQRSLVELLALDIDGQPVAGTQIIVEVFPLGATDEPPLLVRQATTDATGRSSVQLVQLRPGEYEVVATIGDGPPAQERLWVYGARFAGWSVADGEVAVVAERDSYRPGEVATLLVAAPIVQGSLLLTTEQGELLSAEVRTLRAGQVITLPITADMAPGVSIGALVAAGDELRHGATSLRVVGDPAPLQVRLNAGPGEFLPSASAAITITTADGSSPALADLLVTIAPLREGPLGDAADSLAPFEPRPPAPFTTALLAPESPEGPTGAPPPGRTPAQPTGAALALDTGAGGPGTVVARVPLPAEAGRWRLTAYATSGAERIAAASTLITTSLPLAYDVAGPPALRPGDQAMIALELRNTSAVTRSVRATVEATGLNIGGAEERQLSLPPGGAQRLSWMVEPTAGAEQATLRVRVETPGLQQTTSRSIPILQEQEQDERGATIVAAGPLATELALSAPPTGTLRVALAPSLRAALADQAEAIAARANPSVEDAASLALIAAELARSGDAAEQEHWGRFAREALADLDALQNADGGWGWWAGAPSQPFTTAFALEAQAAARAALGESRPASLRAIGYLSRATPLADANTRAYVTYALARAGRADMGPADLADAQLDADGLAFLAMALPPSEATPLIERLRELATREPAAAGEPATVLWTADGSAGLPRSPTAVTAAAAQALAARRPSDSNLPGAERTLLAAWGVDGWATSYEAARVAAALLDDAPAPEGGPRRLLLDGRPLLGDGEPFSTTLRAELPAAGLGARPALRVEAAGSAAYLVAHSVAAPAPASSGGLALHQELVDPASGAPRDAALRPGELVALRVTALVLQPLLRAELELPLPGGLEPLPLSEQGPFAPMGGLAADTHRVTLGAADLTPGVYTYTLMARAVALGSFAAPPAMIRAPYAPEHDVAAQTGIAVTITE